MTNRTQAERDMLQRYRTVFGSGDGRMVLGDIMSRGHVGITLDPDNPAQVSEYNFALLIATMAGAYDTFYPQFGIAIEPPNVAKEI